MGHVSRKRVLVTGGTGFIGARVVQRFRELGWDTHVLVRPSSNSGRLPPGVGIHVDSGTDGSTAAIVSAAAPSLVVHCAGYFISEHTPADVGRLIECNLAFGTRLVDALPAVGDVTFVNCSSFWQHVGGATYRPTSLYAATKQAFEDILRYYVDAGGLRVVSLVLFDTYGPRDPRSKLVNLLMSAAQTGESLDTSEGDQLIDLIHAEDVVDALIKGGSLFPVPPQTYQKFAVSSGRPITIRELAGLVEEASGRRLRLNWGKLPPRRNEMREPWQVAPTLPGWSAKIDLATGLREVWRELSRNCQNGMKGAEAGTLKGFGRRVGADG